MGFLTPGAVEDPVQPKPPKQGSCAAGRRPRAAAEAAPDAEPAHSAGVVESRRPGRRSWYPARTCQRPGPRMREHERHLRRVGATRSSTLWLDVPRSSCSPPCIPPGPEQLTNEDRRPGARRGGPCGHPSALLPQGLPSRAPAGGWRGDPEPEPAFREGCPSPGAPCRRPRRPRCPRSAPPQRGRRGRLPRRRRGGPGSHLHGKGPPRGSCRKSSPPRPAGKALSRASGHETSAWSRPKRKAPGWEPGNAKRRATARSCMNPYGP